MNAIKRNYVNVWRTFGDKFVHAYSILTTDRVIVAVYEKNDGHSSFMTHPDLGVWVGQLTARKLPAEIDAIPVGPARFEAIGDWRKANEKEANDAIRAAFPGVQYFRQGEGETTLDQARTLDR